MISEEKRKELDCFALKIRIGIVEQLRSLGLGHLGGSFSLAETLSVLYNGVMDADPKDPYKTDRDKLVVSKGHSGPALYATLALKGYFPYDKLFTLNRYGTDLPSHTDKNKTRGADTTTGSLGQGTSLACGIALGDKLRGNPYHTFLITGDGEIDEGQAWEAAAFAAGKKVTNLTWIVDNNKKQLDGPTDLIMPLGDIRAKFEAFGFEAYDVDGHDVGALYEALEKSKLPGDRPVCLVLDTVKGKGIEEVENRPNHSVNTDRATWDKWYALLTDELKEKYGEEIR